MADSDKNLINITFLPYNERVSVEKGTGILEGARSLNIPLGADCGGKGLCGRCKVKLIEGTLQTKETFTLNAEDRQKGFVLACTSFPSTDTTVEIPPESLIEEIIDTPPLKSVFGREEIPYPFEPLTAKVYVECPPPSEDDNLPDMERLFLALQRKTGEKGFRLSYKLLHKLPENLRKWQWKVTVTYSPLSSPCEVLCIEEGNTESLHYGVVIDIGTTTVEAVLVNMLSGSVLSRAFHLNPQIKYGEDITARLNFASEEQGLLLLNDAISDKINEILMELTLSAEVDKKYINTLVFSANTVMIHFLLGFNTDYIRRHPHTPAALNYPVFRSCDLNLYTNPEALIYIVPGMGGYTGGDLTSALVSTGMDKETAMLADLGTNGETAVKAGEGVFCAAASAGPAFEGGGLRKGVRASSGAINSFRYSKTKQDFVYSVIGDVAPIGICGPGLIDLLASLLIRGVIDKKGRFVKNKGAGRITLGAEDWEFNIARRQDTGEIISVSERELKYIIRSKGALYTSAEYLLSKSGLGWDDIDCFYISGSLGEHINIENGITIGLFPDIDREKFVFLGNGSLLGGRYILLSKKAWETAGNIVDSSIYFELSQESGYMNEYSSSLFLPHTHLNKFPSIAEKLKTLQEDNCEERKNNHE